MIWEGESDCPRRNSYDRAKIRGSERWVSPANHGRNVLRRKLALQPRVRSGHRSRDERLHETRVARRSTAAAHADSRIGRGESRSQAEARKPSRNVRGCGIVARRAASATFERVTRQVPYVAHDGRGVRSGNGRRPGGRMAARGCDGCHQRQRRQQARHGTERSGHDGWTSWVGTEICERVPCERRPVQPRLAGFHVAISCVLVLETSHLF